MLPGFISEYRMDRTSLRAVYEYSRRYPGILAGIWFTLAATVGPLLLMVVYARNPVTPGSTAFLIVLPLLCAFTAGALYGPPIVDPEVTPWPIQAVLRGMRIILIAYLVYAVIGFVLLTLVAGVQDLEFNVVVIAIGFAIVAIPSMLAGGLGGWLLHRIFLNQEEMEREHHPRF